MGLQDRQYYREDSYSNLWSQAPTASQSIVVTLILINVAIFVLDMFSPVSLDENGNQLASHQFSSFLALHGDVFKKPWLLWELLSYGFAHASVNSKESFFHIGGNMLILFMLGRPVEQQLGRVEFVKFYLVAIVLAGLGWVLLNWNQAFPGMVGASGAVTAVVALFIFMFPHQTLLLFGVVPLKAWVLGVIVVVIDLLRSLNPESPIAWEAHLTGFAFGAAWYHFKWNFHWLQIEKLANPFKSRPSLKVHQPGAGEKLQQEADEILQKINDHGESSLNARERKTLKKYSEQIRKNRD